MMLQGHSTGDSLIGAAEFLSLVHEGVPFTRHMDLRVESLTQGCMTLRLRFHADHIRPGGSVSGPAMMTLADCTMYGVVISAIGRVELAVTTDFTIHFLQRPPPADIIAVGRLLKLGRRLAVCEITIQSDECDAAVAQVTGTYSIPPPDARGFAS
jgi:uncharacterized protein (TIGR00369 family)